MSLEKHLMKIQRSCYLQISCIKQMRQDICLKWKGYKHMEKEYFVMDDDGMDTEISSEMEVLRWRIAGLCTTGMTCTITASAETETPTLSWPR